MTQHNMIHGSAAPMQHHNAFGKVHGSRAQSSDNADLFSKLLETADEVVATATPDGMPGAMQGKLGLPVDPPGFMPAIPHTAATPADQNGDAKPVVDGSVIKPTDGLSDPPAAAASLQAFVPIEAPSTGMTLPTAEPEKSVPASGGTTNPGSAQTDGYPRPSSAILVGTDGTLMDDSPAADPARESTGAGNSDSEVGAQKRATAGRSDMIGQASRAVPSDASLPQAPTSMSGISLREASLQPQGSTASAPVNQSIERSDVPAELPPKDAEKAPVVRARPEGSPEATRQPQAPAAAVAASVLYVSTEQRLQARSGKTEPAEIERTGAAISAAAQGITPKAKVRTEPRPAMDDGFATATSGIVTLHAQQSGDKIGNVTSAGDGSQEDQSLPAFAQSPSPLEGTNETDPENVDVAAPAPVDVTQSEWEAEFIDQITSQITGEGSVIEIALSPDNLGSVEVRMEITNGKAEVSFVTETRDAARILSQSEARLSELLQRQGLDLGGQQTSHRQEDGREAAGRGPGHRAALTPQVASDTPSAAEPAGRLNLLA